MNNLFEIESFELTDEKIIIAAYRKDLAKDIIINRTKFEKWIFDNKKNFWEVNMSDSEGNYDQVCGEMTAQEFWSDTDPLSIEKDLYDFVIETEIDKNSIKDKVFRDIQNEGKVYSIIEFLK